MSTSKGLGRLILVTVISVLVLSVGFLSVVFFHPAMRRLGLEVTGAPSTPPAKLFDAPQSASSPSRHGTGLITSATAAPDGTMPSPAALSKKIAELDRSKAANPTDKAAFAVAAIDVATGNPLGGLNPDQLLIPASNTKTLTITAALHAISPETRFATTVMQPVRGKLVLVGGGDPMLASEPSAPGAYPQRASLAALADQTAAALRSAGTTTVELSYDNSLFQDSWNPTWRPDYRTEVTPISALWADTGIVGHTRAADPAQQAARTFAEQLTKRGISVGKTIAPGKLSGEEIARVESPPLHVLAELAMLHSDNSWTEVIGFHLALATGRAATFAGTTAAVEEQLTQLGLWQKGTIIKDGCGLSRDNRISASMLAAINRYLALDPRLSVAIDGLPVAGVTGTLAQRFTEPDALAARGLARAKTGTLNGVSSLSGLTRTRDGRTVAFAVMVNNSTQPWNARVWMDHVVGTITGCGCS